MGSKIIGRVVVILTFFLWGCAYGSMMLDVTDNRGRSIKQAAVGQPFYIKITMKNMGSSPQPPHIDGIDELHGQRTAFNMTSINGKSTVSYSYQLHADQPGVYTIGPAVAMHKGKKVQSKKYKLTVASQPVVVDADEESDEQEASVFLRLSLNKEKPVVGEPITCSLKLYYSDEDVTFRQLHRPEMAAFTKKNVVGPFGSVAKINGISYACAEWRWQLHPHKQGPTVIPAYAIDYDVPSQRATSGWGQFGMFFGLNTERKRVYSNALELTVDPLPPHDGDVYAVGSFKSVYALIEPAAAKEGEGMVLALEFEGDAVHEELPVPTLTNMPDALKYYESNHAMVQADDPDALPKKRFEFIVQGLKQGTWEIPVQQFTYFDTDTRAYKTIETAPLFVTIMPGAIASFKVPKKPRKNETPLGDSQKSALASDICSLHTGGPWYPIHERAALPWWLFFLLAGVPLVSIACITIREWIQRYRYNNADYLRHKSAFRVARSHIKRALKQDDAIALYSIFVQLIADRCHVSLDQVSSDTVERMLHDKQCTSQEVSKWQYFFLHISERAFGKGGGSGYNDAALFSQAEIWLTRLKEVL